MTIVTNEHMAGLRPQFVTHAGRSYAVIVGKKKPSVKIYRRHEDGWEYVTWAGESAVAIISKAAKDGIL